MTRLVLELLYSQTLSADASFLKSPHRVSAVHHYHYESRLVSTPSCRASHIVCMPAGQGKAQYIHLTE